jgi:hypothetical protein
MTLQPGTWYFAVKAYNTYGEFSAPSQEVSVTITAAPAPSTSVPNSSADHNWELIWQNQNTGQVVGWHMAGTTYVSSALIGTAPGWNVRVAADIDGDSQTDLILQNPTTGELTAWLLTGDTLRESRRLTPDRVNDPNWLLVCAADLNADGKIDLIFHHQQTGVLAAWLMNGTTLSSGVPVTPAIVNPVWRVIAAVDVNGDGKPDLVWRNAQTQAVTAWLMNGTQMTAPALFTVNAPSDLKWQAVATGDINQDGSADLIWQHADGFVATWLMSGKTFIGAALLTPGRVNEGWRVVGTR